MNRRCCASTIKETRCSKKALKWSKYCLLHQDRRLNLAIILAFCAIVVTIIFFVIQERYPFLTAKCDIVENGDPSVLQCIIINSGRGKAKDVHISFRRMLPLQTEVYANPELGITLAEANPLPDPNLHPELALIQKSFSVKIPHIAPKDTIIFQVRTTHPDNLRAAKQVLRIRKEIIDILKSFVECVSKTYPDEITKSWNIELLISRRTKEDNFFTPGRIQYERGIQNVEYFTEEEEIASAIHGELYPKYKKEFISIFQGRTEYKAPVIRIKTFSGERTIAIFPPYIRTYADQMNVSLDELREKKEMIFNPAVPDSY